MNDQSVRAKSPNKTFAFGRLLREGVGDERPAVGDHGTYMFTGDELADVQYVCRSIVKGKDTTWKSLRGTGLLRLILYRMVQLQARRERRNGPCRSIGYEQPTADLPLDERLAEERFCYDRFATVPPLVSPTMDAQFDREQRDTWLPLPASLIRVCIQGVLSWFGLSRIREAWYGHPVDRRHAARSYDQARVALVQHEWESRGIRKGLSAMYADELVVAV